MSTRMDDGNGFQPKRAGARDASCEAVHGCECSANGTIEGDPKSTEELRGWGSGVASAGGAPGGLRAIRFKDSGGGRQRRGRGRRRKR